MSSWECQSCGFRYEPAAGDAAAGVTPGTPFEKLPRAWHCPQCRADKDEFEEADPELDEEDADEEDEFEDDDDSEDDEEAFSDEDDDEEEEPDDDDAEDFAEDEADAEDMEDDDGEEDDDAGLDEEEDEDEAEDDEDFEDDDDAEGDEEGEGDDTDDDEPEDLEESEDDPEEDVEDEGLEDGDDDDFEDYEDEDEDPEEQEEESFDEETRYICTDCGWVFDPTTGHPDSGVVPGTPFDDLPEDWTCPSCGAGQGRFAPHEDAIERAPVTAPVDEVERELNAGDIEHMAETGRPNTELGRPRRLSPGLGELLFRPVPLFNNQVDESVTSLTLIGPRARKPLHLTTPIVVAPIPFGSLTSALKVSIAKATARIGTACTSGGPTLGEARRAAAVYILEVAPGRPAPSPEELLAADAAEIILGRGWGYLEEELAPGRHSIGVLAPITSPEELEELVGALRKSLRGPVGVRLPAGAIEADLEHIMRCNPDYLVLECHGAGSGSMPRHVVDHANLPAWLAVHRARQFLDSRGYDGVGLIAAGDLRSPADFAKMLALGADAVLVATAAVVAMGAWDLRPGLESASREMIDLRFDPNQAVERLVNYLKAATEEIMDFCRLVGKADVHDLDRSDLLTSSEELARALALNRDG